MKAIRLLTLVFSICLIGSTSSYAQRDYRTGIGFRAGPMAGLSLKQFITKREAIEAIISSRWHGTLVQGLYEIHQDIFKDTSLNFYYGGGAHYGHWNLDGHPHPWYDEDGTYSALGIDGIVGLEYSLTDAPLSFSLDWKPMFNVTSYTGFWMDDIGLTIRVYIR